MAIAVSFLDIVQIAKKVGDDYQQHKRQQADRPVFDIGLRDIPGEDFHRLKVQDHNQGLSRNQERLAGRGSHSAEYSLALRGQMELTGERGAGHE